MGETKTIEDDFHTAFNAGRRKNLEAAIAQVAHYRGITVEEVRQALKNIIDNIEAGNTVNL